MSNKSSNGSSGISTDMIRGPETKPRVDSKHEECDYSVHDCSSGGKYQELPTLGVFKEVVPGSRTQRLHERNYHKTNLDKKEDVLSALTKPDTRGPPFENISVPKRVM